MENAQNITEAYKELTNEEIARAFALIYHVSLVNKIVTDDFMKIYREELLKVYYSIIAVLNIKEFNNIFITSDEDHYHFLERIKQMLIDLHHVIKPRRSQLRINEKRQDILDMLKSLIVFFRDESHNKTPLEPGQVQETDPIKDTLEALAKRRMHGRREGSENIRPSLRFKPY